MLIGKLSRHTTAWSAIQKANLYQIRLNDLFNRILLLVNRGRKCTHTDRTAFELFNNSEQQLPIHFVQAIRVDFHSIQRVVGDLMRNAAVIIDLGVIANPAQKTIYDARRTARAPGYL